MEKTVYDVYAYVTGIKNKCRKTDRHQIKLGENLEREPTKEELESQAKIAIISQMRTREKNFKVSVCRMKLRQEGDFQVKTYSPFSDTVRYEFSFMA